MILRTHNHRPGAITPFAAFVLPLLLVMAAFMVDMGHILVTMTELQTASDAAALAGAGELVQPSGFGGYDQDAASVSAIAAARAQAKAYSAANRAGGVNIDLADDDIVVGYQASPKADVVPWSPGQPFPNAVKVVTRRDGLRNSPLPLFIGPAIGTPTWSGHAGATATYMEGRYDVTGFQPQVGTATPKLLPIGVDVNYVNTFLATGRSPDGVIHDEFTATVPRTGSMPPANVANGPDHIPELTDVYPNKTSPGNFGLVNLNYTDPVNNQPQFSQWILYGPTAADIATFGPNGFQATPSAPVTIKGGPGLKSSLMPDLDAIIGQPRILPIFSSYTGQGSNTYYTIVGFLGVTVVKAEGRGSNEDISFEPMAVVDPTATSVPARPGNGGKTRFVFTTSPVTLTR
ncbi:MAG: hypothetical protein J2P46_00775 [Zavarzinella sp.]|nr:hypothetical protein [Zavarzinella sp.]